MYLLYYINIVQLLLLHNLCNTTKLDRSSDVVDWIYVSRDLCLPVYLCGHGFIVHLAGLLFLNVKSHNKSSEMSLCVFYKAV